MCIAKRVKRNDAKGSCKYRITVFNNLLRFLYLSILLSGFLSALTVVASMPAARATENMHKNDSSVNSARSSDEFEDSTQIIVPLMATPSLKRTLMPDTPRVSAQLFCVRTCDGYYFPIELPREIGGIGNADSICHKVCPGTEVEVYYEEGNSEAIEDAVSQDLRNYKTLDNAFRYRTEVTINCKCHKSVDFSEEVLSDPTLREGDLVATSQGLLVFKAFEYTNDLKHNFVSARLARIPPRFEAEIRNIEQQYSATVGQSPRDETTDEVGKPTGDGIWLMESRDTRN